jgi:hypothetical protein
MIVFIEKLSPAVREKIIKFISQSVGLYKLNVQAAGSLYHVSGAESGVSQFNRSLINHFPAIANGIEWDSDGSGFTVKLV